MRPKQLTLDREPPVHAMRQRGIMYLELRSLDISVFEPLGVSLEQLHFLEVFMLHALLSESPPIDDQEMIMLADNRKNVAHQGRDPELQLQTLNGPRLLKDCASELLDGLDLVADFMDTEAASAKARYRSAVEAQRQKINDYSKTPSASVLQLILDRDISFVEFGREQSLKAADYCNALEEDSSVWPGLQAAVGESLQKQREIEAADKSGFDSYLNDYLAQLESGNVHAG